MRREGLALERKQVLAQVQEAAPSVRGLAASEDLAVVSAPNLISRISSQHSLEAVLAGVEGEVRLLRARS